MTMYDFLAPGRAGTATGEATGGSASPSTPQPTFSQSPPTPGSKRYLDNRAAAAAQGPTAAVVIPAVGTPGRGHWTSIGSVNVELSTEEAPERLLAPQARQSPNPPPAGDSIQL